MDLSEKVPPPAKDRVARRSRSMMRYLRAQMKALEAQGWSRKRIALELSLTTAQVTRGLGARRCWKDRRLGST